MTRQLVLGLDFGTLSVRALLVDAKTGLEYGEGSAEYACGVMDSVKASPLPSLPKDFALQHAPDYLVAMEQAVQAAFHQMPAEINGTSPEIFGIGVAFTASSPMPTTRDGTPLSEVLPADPHSYVKLWKHHAAQRHADRINAAADPNWLARYGGKISCEWTLPKLLELEASSPEAFEATHYWVEAGDWLVSTLVGHAERPVRSQCQAGYKASWTKESGYPQPALLEKLSPRVARRFETLFAGAPQPLGSPAGRLTKNWAERLGITGSPVVAVAAIDAHAGVPGSGVAHAGEMLSVVGTSTCHMSLARDLRCIPGIECAVQDGIIPGLVGYEAGQPAVGDLFGWFAKLLGESTSFAQLEEEATAVSPGSNGVAALDWWNGTRSVLMDSRLKGTWAGLRLSTTRAEMYRALLESTAYTMREIIDVMSAHDVGPERVLLSGGIATKSPLLCQIYADVLDRPVEVVHARQPVAMGAAIYAAAATLGEPIERCVARMTSGLRRATVEPKNGTAYHRFYLEHRRLSSLMQPFY